MKVTIRANPPLNHVLVGCEVVFDQFFRGFEKRFLLTVPQLPESVTRDVMN